MGITVYRTLDIVLAVIQYSIFARVIVSWLPINKDNKLIMLLYQITDPILVPIRRIIEKSAIGKNTMFDFSPIVAFILIGIIRNLLVRYLYTLI